jgi:hypothetical protein
VRKDGFGNCPYRVSEVNSNISNYELRTFPKVGLEDGCYRVRVQVARCALQHIEIRTRIEL